jgi:hypothetical protein
MRKTVIALAMSGVLLTAACGGQDEGEGALEQATVAAEGAASSARRAQQDDDTTTSTTAPEQGESGGDAESEGDDGGDTVVIEGSEVNESSIGDGSTGGTATPCEAPVPALRQRTADAPPDADTPDCGPTPEPELGTGDVQVTLRWESSADVDLHVFEPDGSEIYFAEPGPTSTGGQLDVDSNVGCEQEASVENAFWPTGGAPEGDYRIEVVGYQVDGCGSGAYTVTATVRGEEVLVESGEVGEDEVDSYEFSA